MCRFGRPPAPAEPGFEHRPVKSVDSSARLRLAASRVAEGFVVSHAADAKVRGIPARGMEPSADGQDRLSSSIG